MNTGFKLDKVKHFTNFKYKGKNYSVAETEFDEISGFRYNSENDKISVIAISTDLSENAKQSTLHKLIASKKNIII